METQLHTNCLHRLAVPYYGRLVTPRLGLSPIYFVADIDPGSAKIQSLDVLVWDLRQEPSLACWLRKQGVNGLLCSDSQLPCLDELAQQGVWVRASEGGEAMEMLERWALAGDPPFLNASTPTQSRSAA